MFSEMFRKKISQKLAFLILGMLATSFSLFFLLYSSKEIKSYTFLESMLKNEVVRKNTFNPDNLEWKQATADAPWSERDSHAVIVFQDKLWLMGGLNGNGFQDKNGNVPYWKVPHYSDIWCSENGEDWELITESAPWGERRSLQLEIFKDKIWLIGGWGPKIGYSNNIWVSEDAVNWEKIKPEGGLPAIEGHQLVIFKNKMWLIGGVRYDERREKNYVWSSEDGINWVEVTPNAPWEPRWDHTVTAFKDKLWLIGGMDLNGNVYKDIWSSEDGENWVLVTPGPSWPERQGHDSVVFQDKIWTVGRLNISGDNDVWYSDNGYNWEKVPGKTPWTGREDQASIVFKNKIWVLGGMNSNWEWENDVWYLK